MTRLRPWATALLAVGVTLCLALWVAANTPGDARQIDTALDATLVVHSADGSRFLGSAFLWQDGEVAVTNAHILAGDSRVLLTNRANQSVIADLRTKDSARDVAVLDLSRHMGNGLNPAPAPELGSPVIAVGAPLEAGFTVTRGVMSAHRQVLPAVPLRFLQHDAAINPGSSGGPLLDERGHVVAMNTRIADGSRFFVGISYAVPADVIAGVVSGQLPPVPELGLALRHVSPAVARSLGIEVTPGGLLIDDVTPGGTAEAAGLKAGDVLFASGLTELSRPGDLAMVLAQTDGPLPLSLHRGSELVELTLTPTPPAAAETRSRASDPMPKQATFAGLGITLNSENIVQLDENGPAYAAGLATGDRIEAIGASPFAGQIRMSLPALLRVRRGDVTTHILIDPTRRVLRPLGGGNALDPDVTLF